MPRSPRHRIAAARGQSPRANVVAMTVLRREQSAFAAVTESVTGLDRNSEKRDGAALSNRPPVVVWLCLAALLGLGLALYRDYGVSFDEATDRNTGQVSLAYVLTRLPSSWLIAMS